MIKNLLNIVLIITLIMFLGAAAKSHAEVHERSPKFPDQTEGYTLDPVISGGAIAPYGPTQSRVITVGKKADLTQIQLESSRQVAPYIGAGTPPPPSEAVLPMVSKEERAPHNKIHLETGIGVNVTENTNVNLGYRIQSNASPLEDHQQDDGQVRFGIDFRLPSK